MKIYNTEYNKEHVYGLSKSLFNYIISNNIFDKFNKNMKIEIKKVQCICLLKDNKRFLDFYEINKEEEVFQIDLFQNKEKKRKYGKKRKILDYLKNLNNIFSSDEVDLLIIRKVGESEIL